MEKWSFTQSILVAYIPYLQISSSLKFIRNPKISIPCTLW